MQPVTVPNTNQQLPMLNSLPLQQHIQMTNQQQQQVNATQYQQNYQPNFVQNPQQQQVQPLQQMSQGQYLSNQQPIQPIQPQLQQQYVSNQQSPTQQQQNMLYSFQPLSPQPQRNVMQSDYNRSA